MTKVTIDIEPHQYKLLKAIAKEDDSSIARVCRMVIKGYIASKKPQNKGYNRGEIEENEDEIEYENVLYNADGSIKG